MGGETLAAENEVELEVVVVRSRPSCLMLSSTGWVAVTSFQSCWRSEGQTAVAQESEQRQQGRGAAPRAPSLRPDSPNLTQRWESIAWSWVQQGEAARPHRETQNKAPAAPTGAVPRREESLASQILALF